MKSSQPQNPYQTAQQHANLLSQPRHPGKTQPMSCCPGQDMAKSACPMTKPGAADSILQARPADSTKFGLVKFGMERSPLAGCCVTRFVGGKSGCCAGIKSGKPFEQEYIKALVKHIEQHEEMPKIDPRAEKKLKELGESERIHALATKLHQAKLEREALENKRNKPPSLLKKVFTAPFKWVKWLAVGFWEDLKLLFSGKRG